MTPLPEPTELALPPLSLYVHLPWCVRKCPYCDFNSHAAGDELPADAYVDALLRDLEQDLPLVWGRTVQSVFFGGGTPSLFTARQIETMIVGFRGLLNIAPGAEVTLEANPGTTEYDSFSAYREAGVNRISLGVQSFDDGLLKAIGRIHGRSEIEQAIESIARAGLENYNLDLMYALPGQSVELAVEDIRLALAAGPTHLSHYQLTLEPNTVFHASPPVLPNEDAAWEMQQACASHVSDAGMENYEISAWCRPGRACRHNLNYWEYGDFLGIGAGAHGKLTLPAEGAVRRLIRQRHPRTWMEGAVRGDSIVENRAVDSGERVFEFFLNQLRLRGGVRKSMFTPRTGLSWKSVEDRVEELVARGLLEERDERLVPTETGWRFVNEIQAVFLP
jgi:oxygen-independent coproporphyrinogen-3 oxidase